ncbi:hypothetical protein IBTHAUMO2_790012 [Nitrosopumilaceae archaeon]|nr:hypothetical protein IBTHAUMO2_790012 [Nitrosopumilaceae archaeon]
MPLVPYGISKLHVAAPAYVVV